MAFLLGVCRYELGDANETLAVMDEIVSLCGQGEMEKARDRAEATKRHIAASPDLLGRPYIVRRFQDIMEILVRAEREISG